MNAVHGGTPPLIGRRALLGGALGGAAAFALGACDGGSPQASSTNSGPPKGRTGTLRVAIPAEPKTIDPALAVELNEYAALRNVYDGLTQWNPTYSGLSPALATSWSSNADATEWVFTLRSGVTFHDGTPLTSTAVRDSMRYYIEKGNGAYFGDLKSIGHSDPNRVKITLSAPFPDLARSLTWSKIISPRLLAEKGAVTSRAVGTGAFRWDSWQHGHQITLKPNAGYWGRPAPYLQEVDLVVVNNESARVAGLTSGSLDLIEQVDPHDLALLRSDPRVSLASAPTWEEICLLFVCSEGPTKDPRVRQAIAYGIDRKAITEHILNRQGQVADSPIPVGCYGHSTPDVQYEYNPGKARQLLSAAGYPNGISLAMAGSSDLSVEALIGQAMTAQLKEAGINASFVVQDLGVMVNDVVSAKPKRQAYIIHYGWNGFPWHFNSGDIFQHAKYTGRTLLDQVKAARTTADGQKRTEYLNTAQRTFMQELPHLPLYYPVQTDAMSKKVGGFQLPRDTYQPVLTQTFKR